MQEWLIKRLLKSQKQTQSTGILRIHEDNPKREEHGFKFLRNENPKGGNFLRIQQQSETNAKTNKSPMARLQKDLNRSRNWRAIEYKIFPLHSTKPFDMMIQRAVPENPPNELTPCFVLEKVKSFNTQDLTSSFSSNIARGSDRNEIRKLK